MIDVRHERMGDHFEKFHLGGLPFPAVLHCFSAPDHGPPHNHPFRFRSHILSGGYVEEVFDRTGYSVTKERKVGDSFIIEAEHIHRIIALPRVECWTLMLPLGPKVQEPGFYDFRPDGAYHRFWHEAEFRRISE